MKGLIPLILLTLTLIGIILLSVQGVAKFILFGLILLFAFMLYGSLLYLNNLRMMKMIAYPHWLNQIMLVVGKTFAVFAWRTTIAKKIIGKKDNAYSKEYQKTRIIVGYFITFILIPGLILLSFIFKI